MCVCVAFARIRWKVEEFCFRNKKSLQNKYQTEISNPPTLISSNLVLKTKYKINELRNLTGDYDALQTVEPSGIKL